MKLVQDFPLIHMLATRAKMSREPLCDFLMAKRLTANIEIPEQYHIYFQACESYFFKRYGVENLDSLYNLLDPRSLSCLHEALIIDLANEFRDGFIFMCPSDDL